MGCVARLECGLCFLCLIRGPKTGGELQNRRGVPNKAFGETTPRLLLSLGFGKARFLSLHGFGFLVKVRPFSLPEPICAEVRL
jgi:hypothetical protein